MVAKKPDSKAAIIVNFECDDSVGFMITGMRIEVFLWDFCYPNVGWYTNGTWLRNVIDMRSVVHREFLQHLDNLFQDSRNDIDVQGFVRRVRIFDLRADGDNVLEILDHVAALQTTVDGHIFRGTGYGGASVLDIMSVIGLKVSVRS